MKDEIIDWIMTIIEVGVLTGIILYCMHKGNLINNEATSWGVCAGITIPSAIVSLERQIVQSWKNRKNRRKGLTSRRNVV